MGSLRASDPGGGRRDDTHFLRAWFGMRFFDATAPPVLGDDALSSYHLSMAPRSYECPSTAVTAIFDPKGASKRASRRCSNVNKEMWCQQ